MLLYLMCGARIVMKCIRQVFIKMVINIGVTHFMIVPVEEHLRYKILYTTKKDIIQSSPIEKYGQLRCVLKINPISSKIFWECEDNK